MNGYAQPETRMPEWLREDIRTSLRPDRTKHRRGSQGHKMGRPKESTPPHYRCGACGRYGHNRRSCGWIK